MNPDLGNRLYWRSLKNKHRGRRGFVIGNGPSLRMEDLDLLRDEITIASNKVYLAFEKTAWRPDYFTCVDALVWRKICDLIHLHTPAIHLPAYLASAGLPDDSCEVHYWRQVRTARPYNGNDIEFSEDLSIHAFGGYTVTFENLQLAAHIGLNPIILVGCDHYYAGESDVQADSPIKAGAGNNHFVEGYRQPGETVNPAMIEIMNNAFRHARLYAQRTGCRILNATRGGHLDIFERADFDLLVKGGTQ